MADPDPVFVTIGGEKITLPPILVFADLERIWPAMKALDATTDVVERGAARLAIISGALKTARPELTVAELKSRLKIGGFTDGTDEVSGLIMPVIELLARSGLMAKDPPAGEAAPAAIPPEPLTQTGTI